MQHSIRVVLADDHPLIRSGMCTLLSATPDIAVVGQVSNGDEALCVCREVDPDVLVLDYHMPGTSAVDTIAALHLDCPRTYVVVLTAYDDEAYVRSLVMVGVSGYVLKDEALETLVGAIRSASQGNTWFSRTVMAKLAHQRSAAASSADAIGLTEREQQILRLIALGWDNAHIAATLHLAEQTVRNYVSRLYVSIGLHSRAEAVVWAREQGLGGR